MDMLREKEGGETTTAGEQKRVESWLCAALEEGVRVWDDSCCMTLSSLVSNGL